MTETEVVKKKRGPKPKSEKLKTSGKKEPKKRGRKPKSDKKKLENDKTNLPKKRGRKPKEVIANVQKYIVKDEPIILHLPIKTPQTNDIYIPKPFINMDKFNSKYKNIDSNIKPNLETSINKITDISITDSITGVSNDTDITECNVINKFNELCSEYSNVIERDKVFPIFLEFIEYNKKQKWPDSTSIDCLWCCHEFDTFPFGIPIKKYEETYYMFGNFCSAECSAAYNFDNNNSSESFERYSLINYLYSNDKEIKVAGPRLSLKKFGGQLSITEFRNNNNIYSKHYKLLLPPMISLIPLVEEVNLIDNKISLDNNDNLFNLDDSELKLKRNKPLPESYNTLENCMNLKLV
jgi:hypothetical protein